MSRNIFITGTGTDVGKTYVTGLIVKKLKESGADAAYYKAAMSGNERRADSSLIPGDALQVKTMSGIRQPLEEMCPYIYETAVSPHLASRLEGNPVRMETVLEKFHEVCEKYEYVTVEGSGGILCPLCFDEADLRLPDVVKACDLGCQIVKSIIYFKNITCIISFINHCFKNRNIVTIITCEHSFFKCIFSILCTFNYKTVFNNTILFIKCHYIISIHFTSYNYHFLPKGLDLWTQNFLHT